MTRLHPTDRHSPRLVTRGLCPMSRQCGCCPGPAGIGHFTPGQNGQPGKQITDCRMVHPPHNRQCRPPYPGVIPPCPERESLNQTTPTGSVPAGRCCIECGRVTARVYLPATGEQNTPLPWCAGIEPGVELPARLEAHP